MQKQIQLCIHEITKKETIHTCIHKVFSGCLFGFANILYKSFKSKFFYSKLFLSIKLQKLEGPKSKSNLIFKKYFTCDISIFNAICISLLSSIFLIGFKETVFYSISVYIFQKFLNHLQNALKGLP